VSINDDGAFDDWGFHDAPFEHMQFLITSYRDSVPRGHPNS
jgi:hypothetical protein